MPAIKSLNQAVRAELLELQQLVQNGIATKEQQDVYKRMMDMMTPEFSAQLKSSASANKSRKSSL